MEWGGRAEPVPERHITWQGLSLNELFGTTGQKKRPPVSPLWAGWKPLESVIFLHSGAQAAGRPDTRKDTVIGNPSKPIGKRMISAPRPWRWRQSSQEPSSGTPWSHTKESQKTLQILMILTADDNRSRPSRLKPFGGMRKNTVIQNHWKTVGKLRAKINALVT